MNDIMLKRVLIVFILVLFCLYGYALATGDDISYFEILLISGLGWMLYKLRKVTTKKAGEKEEL